MTASSGIRFYNDRVTCLEEHISRLFDSAKAIHMEIPATHEEVCTMVVETIRQNDLHDGYVRLVITRGTGGLGLSPYRCEKASIIVIASTISLYPKEKYEQGLILATCATRRPTHDSLSPSVKSLNYLSNVMAKVEALAAGAEEGVMLNTEGYVAECTGDNIFVVKDGIIYTPTVASGSLTESPAGWSSIWQSKRIRTPRDSDEPLRQAPQMNCFLPEQQLRWFLWHNTTSAKLVSKPGPVTKRLIEDYRNLVETTGTPIY